MIVADLVATLTLDDQMSAGLAKAGQQIDALAARSGKSAGEALGASQRQVAPQPKSHGKAVTDALGGALDMAAGYSQALADASAAIAALAAAQTAALATTTALGAGISQLTANLRQLSTASESAVASMSALPGILREVAAARAEIKAAGDDAALPGQEGGASDLLEDVHDLLPGPLGDIAGLGALIHKTNFLGLGDVVDEAVQGWEEDIAKGVDPSEAARNAGRSVGQRVVAAAKEGFELGIAEGTMSTQAAKSPLTGMNGPSILDLVEPALEGFFEPLDQDLNTLIENELNKRQAPDLMKNFADWMMASPEDQSTMTVSSESMMALAAQISQPLLDLGDELDRKVSEFELSMDQLGLRVLTALNDFLNLGGLPGTTGPLQDQIDELERSIQNQERFLYGYSPSAGEASLNPQGELPEFGTVPPPPGYPEDRTIDDILREKFQDDPAMTDGGAAAAVDAGTANITADSGRLAVGSLAVDAADVDAATKYSLDLAEYQRNKGYPGPYVADPFRPEILPTWDQDSGYGALELGRAAINQVPGDYASQQLGSMSVQAQTVNVSGQIQQQASGLMQGGQDPLYAPQMTGMPDPTSIVPSPGLGGVPGTTQTAGDMGVGAMLASAQQALTAGMTQLQTAAQTGMTALQTTITTAMTSAATAVQSGAQQIIAAVNSIGPALSAAAASAAATAGTIGDGIVAALNADVGAVQAAASALASAAESGINGVVQPGSPSRMAIPYGQSIGEGLAFGMQQKSPEVLAAAEKLGYSAEQGLQPLMDGMSMTGLAAGKALGVDMEQALAQQVNGMEGWDPKSQIDHEALLAFQDAAVKMARYGKRAGDEAATKAGEAFKGLADNMSAVLMGSETYLSDELAKDALMSYRKLDAEAKKKLPDGIKEQLKSTYDEANITIGDVIKQRMGGRLGEGMDLKGRFQEAKENILRGMLGQRTLEQKAQAAAEDGLSLAIDSIKSGLMQGGQDAQSAMKGAIDSALGGGPGEAMKGGMLESMFGGAAGGADPEEFAWALCECISGANQEMLGSLGLGNPAETATAMLGHELSNQIAGTGDEFRGAMLDYAKQNPALNLPTQWLEDETASQCMNICDKAASEMGGAAGDAAGAAMGAGMPAMPSGADFGKAAGGALGSQMQSQCVSLCGGSTDDLASGVANGVADAGIGEMAAKDAMLQVGATGARELGKSLRSGIPGATSPAMPGATPDDMASGVADGLTSQCVSLCDDSGMSDAAGSLDSAASGMSDMGGQIEQLTQSLVSQKFGETMKGIQDGLSGGGTGGIPSGVEVPDHILKLNPNINRALNFDIAQTNPHAAALLGGASPVHLQGLGTGGGGTPSGFQDGGGEQTINVNLNVDGEKLASTSVKYMGRGLGMALTNSRRSGGSMMGSRRG